MNTNPHVASSAALGAAGPPSGVPHHEGDSCPSEAMWRNLLQGMVDDPTAEQLESHLAGCPTCGDTFAEVAANSASGETPRLAATAAGWLAEPELLELYRRGMNLLLDPVLRNAETGNGDPTEHSLAAELSPTELGGYRLAELLGSGGMGEVYRATHLLLHRPVAIKVISARLHADPQSRRRFCREIVSTGRVTHPNVIAATDAGEDRGRMFLVMELLEGTDLRSLSQQQGRLPPATACEVIRQAAEGLIGIHSQDLVHRDIKPSNLFLTAEGVVKILDLGLAKLTVHDEEELTHSGVLLGTRSYLAPEQAHAPGKVDFPADLYSLGCVFFKLLTGESLLPAEEREPRFQYPSTAELQQRLAASGAGIPEGLTPLLLQLLSPEPAARPTAETLAREWLPPHCEGHRLEEFAREAASAAAQSRAEAPTASARPHNPRDETRSHFPSRRTVVLGLAGLGFPLTAAAILANGGALRDRVFRRPLEIDLFEDEPQPLIALEPSAKEFVRFNRERRELTVKALEPTLFPLGELQEGQDSVEIEVWVHQAGWKGDFGFYFGLEKLIKMERNIPQNMLNVQTLEIRSVNLPPAPTRLLVYRRFLQFNLNWESRSPDLSAQGGGSMFVPVPKEKWVRLRLTLQRDGVRDGTFDNTSLAQFGLRGSTNAKVYDSVTGAFGLLASGPTVIFSHPKAIYS